MSEIQDHMSKHSQVIIYKQTDRQQHGPAEYSVVELVKLNHNYKKYVDLNILYKTFNF